MLNQLIDFQENEQDLIELTLEGVQESKRPHNSSTQGQMNQNKIDNPNRTS